MAPKPKRPSAVSAAEIKSLCYEYVRLKFAKVNVNGDAFAREMADGAEEHRRRRMEEIVSVVGRRKLDDYEQWAQLDCQVEANREDLRKLRGEVQRQTRVLGAALGIATFLWFASLVLFI